MTVDALAARILVLAADNLRRYETIQGWLPGTEFAQCMTEGLRDIEVARAIETVLIRIAKWSTVDETRALVTTLIPPVAGTVAEFADRLRETATEVDSRTTLPVAA